MGNKLITLLRRAEHILRKIIIPGYDVDIISSGLIVKLRISKDGSVLGVSVNLSGFDPRCLYCSTLNEYLIVNMSRKAYSELVRNGFKEVYFFDYRTNRLVDLELAKYVLKE